MKHFIKTNEITYNLMSFSGFKGILLFSYLLEAPRTYKEMIKYFEEHPYLNETVSLDTIRIYINTLKKIGCDVKVDVINRVRYYSIVGHPFELKINDEQTKSIIKIYKAISKSIDLEDYMALRHFFENIAKYITNDYLKEQIVNLSPLKSMDLDLLKELIKHTNAKAEITVTYDSPNSGLKNIDILTDKLYITNGKLYLAGINSEYENYGSLLVNKIKKIVSVNLQNSKFDVPELKVKFTLKKSDNEVFEPADDETIVEENADEIFVEKVSKNKFGITQRIMSFGSRCKIISPDDYKQEIISNLKQMKEVYLGSKE